MAVTIYDIARQADVSIATVSRVLNGSTRVSEATRQRVFEVARRLRYAPNASARSLAGRRSQVIAAVIPMLTNYFFIEVIRGIQDALANTDYSLLVYSASTPEETDVQVRSAIQTGRSGGMLLFSSSLRKAEAKRIREAGHPVVLVDSMHPDFDSVAVDNHLGGIMATEHLIEQGYHRTALVMGYPLSAPAAGRRMGYLEALTRHGLKCEEEFIVAGEEHPHHGFTESFGYQAGIHLLSGKKLPDAVFATSDTQALGVLRAAQDRSIRVPEELGVIGFDDIMVSRYVGLSTLRQPMFEMGRLAIRLLLNRMENPDREVSHTVFSPILVERDTTRRRSV